jgi:hypothetical protein
MIFRGEHHQTIGIEIEIARRNRFRRPLPLLRKFANALLANTGSVLQFRRDASKQFVRNRNARTPAWPLVTANPAELTVIPATTKRAKLGVQPLAFRKRMIASDKTPTPAIKHAPGSGTTETASICVLPLNTSIRRKLALSKSTLFPLPSRAHDKSKPAPPADPP